MFSDILQTRGEGVLQIRTSDLFSAKRLDFSKFMVCTHGQGELIQCGHFADKGEGSIFYDFVLTSFYGRPYSIRDTT